MLWKIIRSLKEIFIISPITCCLTKHLLCTHILPAPALFEYHSKGRYFVLESEARAHSATVEAARQAEASAPRASVSYHADYYPDYWLLTKLDQKPKAWGSTCFSLTLHSCLHISFQLSVSTLFHCIIHVKFIFLISSCVFEKLWENPKIFPASFLFFFLE